MKVLHVVDKMNPERGGVCQAIRSIIKGLSSIDIENEVLCLDNPNESFISNDPFTAHALGPSENNWTYSAKLIPWLLSCIQDFDIVISHGLWQYPGYAAFKTWKKLCARDNGKTKFYVMPHGMLDPYFQKASSRKLKAIRNTLYWKLIEAKVVNGVDGILFTCEEEERLASEPFTPYKPKQTFIVSLGVETPPAFNLSMTKALIAKCPQINESPYILFLSRIHEKKGINLLIRTYGGLFRKLHKNHDIEFPKLIIAGPGMDSTYGRLLIALSKEAQLPKDALQFVGMLEGDAKWGAFYHSEAFVLPSHQENFGIAVVEALACGKPVLISNQINIWREIQSSGAGFVNDASIKGTEDLLSRWISLTNSEKSEMSEKARRAFNANFTVLSATEKLAKAITN